MHLHHAVCGTLARKRRRLRCRGSTPTLHCRRDSRNPRRNGDSWRCGTSRGGRRTCGRWGRRNFGRNHHHRRRTVSGGYRTRRHHSGRGRRGRIARGLSWFRLRHNWRWSFCFGFDRRHRSRRLDGGARRRLLNDCLLLSDGPQYVPGPRNVREVDLGLDLFFAVSGPRRRLRRTGRRIGAAAEMPAHQFRFMIL